jgi:hypothetical protein
VRTASGCRDRGGQPSTACKFVLVGLANHAGPDGAGAFPSVATLVRYIGLAKRTVRICLDRLTAGGIISPCDPDIVAARIKSADRRPQGWDLNLSLVRHDLDDAALTVLDRQLPGRGGRLTPAARPGTDGQADWVQAPHPVAVGSAAVDNWPGGVQPLHPAPGTGCNSCRHGYSGCTRTIQGTVPRTVRRPRARAPGAACSKQVRRRRRAGWSSSARSARPGR